MSERDRQVNEQLAGLSSAAQTLQVERALKDLHTCLPGIIHKYDADSQTAEVQPAIKRVFTEAGPVNLPLCVDVPVAFPGGGDLYLTFPVQPGDECLLMFSERAIDNWMMDGGVAEPVEFRLHDLSDGIALVGLNSQPNKLTNVQTDGAELRTRDRSIYIKMTASGIIIKGDITLEGNITQTGDINQTGGITSSGDHVAGNISQINHSHADPQGGVVGQPI